MTLARTALRLLTVAAIAGATNAQGRVYDSRVDDLSPDVFGEDAKPVIVVNTDEDKGDALSDQDGGPPFRRMIDLSIQIGMVTRNKLADDDDDRFIYPETDADLEAALDWIEDQILDRLGSEPEELLCCEWRRLARIVKYDCHRQIDDEAGMRLAVRVLTLTCDTKDSFTFRYNDVRDVLPTGLAKLPEPLKSVAALIPAGSSGRRTLDALAASIVVPTVPNFEGVDTIADASTVVVTATTNIDIASAPASIGGVVLADGNRIALAAQTDTEENGIYFFTAVGDPLTRETNIIAQAIDLT
jgi:hypothetical protein